MRFLFIILIVILILLLLGCESQPKKPQVTEVPVAISCLKDPPTEKPVFKFDGLPAPKSEEETASQIRVLWHDREDADNYGKAWEKAAAGCLLLGSPSP